MKSTVPCGTGAAIQRVFGEQGKAGLRYVSCPEFLKEGSAVDDFLRPDRVVVGDNGDWAGDAVVELYRPLLTAGHGGGGEGELVRTDIASAEMVKLASNAFLATKISLINEIANVCEETGADVSRSRAAWASTRASARSSCRRGSATAAPASRRTSSALKQLAGNSGYHFQLLDGRDRGQRAAEAARDRQAVQALSAASSASASRCSASRSSPTPTTCARRPRWCSRRGWRPMGRRSPRSTRSPSDEARKLLRGLELADCAMRRVCRAPTRSCS